MNPPSQRSCLANLMHSDNLIADRRFGFGQMLLERGDLEGAISLFEETLEAAPDWAAAHFTLAETLEKAGRLQDACSHFTAYLRLAENDAMGAEIRLALLGAAPVPAVLPEAYVKTLFDQYAERFEESLLTRLEYNAPNQLLAAVDRILPIGPVGARVLDLGCGTGLAGEVFRGRAAWLGGVDLSPKMIAEAARKCLYEDLRETDALSALGAYEGALDLIVAADVLVYMGDLSALFQAAARALKADGLFAFSVQQNVVGDFTLGAECRYSHHADYIAALLAAVGLDNRASIPTTCRLEAGVAVPHLICVASKPAAIAEDSDEFLPTISGLRVV